MTGPARRNVFGAAGAVEKIIDGLIRAEGGYVDHTADRGGPTKYGITRKTLTAWRGRDVTARDVEDLSEDEARDIYRSEYIIRPGFDRIDNPALRAQVIDAGVHHGPGWAARRLQEVAGVAADGVVGPITLRAVNFAAKLGPTSPGRSTGFAEAGGLAAGFAARRIRKLARIVANDPSQLPFLIGWIDRATSFLED